MFPSAGKGNWGEWLYVQNGDYIPEDKSRDINWFSQWYQNDTLSSVKSIAELQPQYCA